MQSSSFPSNSLLSSTTSDSDQRPVIACIDDSKTIQRHVKLILESVGFRVLGLTEPTRALTALVRSRPVLVLMDITMPDVDGYELCRMLRRTSGLAEVPILMLTGKDGIVDRIRARGVGATGYLTKPFRPHELLAKVQEMLASQSTSTGSTPALKVAPSSSTEVSNGVSQGQPAAEPKQQGHSEGRGLKALLQQSHYQPSLPDHRQNHLLFQI